MDDIAQLTTALAGQYDVEREIGRGGMAAVYLARDVRHHRKVALKVLNSELGAVLGVERFFAEIEVTANLQHPNLLPLFDSGEAGGQLYYVMPYIEGESLRAKLLREKQLPIDEALHIATSVCSALDYAHRHGVIHRDLKPENILIHDGQPVVADFGIALAVSNAGGNRITQTGLSLGTPHYMSPEQATGDRDIDARTDVYSMGAVLYEMLVGEAPHDGKTSQAIIAKVLTDKPRSIRLARDTVPPHVEAAVERALAKLPADRFHTAKEFADALTGRSLATVGAGLTQAQPSMSPAHRATTMRRALPWIITAAAVLVGAFGWTSALRRTERADVVRYEIPLPAELSLSLSRVNPVAISTNGQMVAYVAQSGDNRQRLFIRSAGDLQPREVGGAEGATSPFFSPDGQWIAFWSSGQLRKIPVAGGSAVTIADQPDGGTSAWTESGWIVSTITVNGAYVLGRVASTGGTLEPFTQMDAAAGETGQFNPVALPDGETVLYSSNAMGGAANARIGIASLRDGSSTVLDVQGSFPLGVVDGQLIYTSAGGTVLAVPIDVKARRVSGTPVALVDQVAVSGTNPTSFAQLSPDGSLVYVSGVAQRQIVMVRPNGTVERIGEPGPYSWPSRSGRQRVATSGPMSSPRGRSRC